MGRPLLDKLAGSTYGHSWAQSGRTAGGPIPVIMTKRIWRSLLRQLSGDRHHLLNKDNWVVSGHWADVHSTHFVTALGKHDAFLLSNVPIPLMHIFVGNRLNYPR
jgi:hypothetical protein